MHGGHQVAKKVTSSTLPSSSLLSSTALSVREGSLNCTICMCLPIGGEYPPLVSDSGCLQASSMANNPTTRRKYLNFMFAPGNNKITFTGQIPHFIYFFPR